MIESRYAEWIHQKIDGVISVGENEELQRYLRENPEAQQLYNDLLAVGKGLAALEEREPSPNLKKNIMNRIPARKYDPREKKNFLPGFFSGRNLTFQLKLGYAFSAGLIAGFLLLVFVTKIFLEQPALNIDDLQGTMAPGEKSKLPERSEVFNINLPEVNGKILLQYSKEKVRLELRLQSPREIEISLGFPESDIRFSGFLPGGPSGSALFMKKRELTLIHRGDNSYTLLFDRSSPMEAAINFSILQNEVRLMQEQILIKSE
jgi:hypothetical protein